MKQIIEKDYFSKDLRSVYYINDYGEYDGLFLRYYGNNKLHFKANYKNDKRFGLASGYSFDSKLKQQKYYL